MQRGEIETMGERIAVYNFVSESNRIEGILRQPTDAELAATSAFLGLASVAVSDLCEFVSICAPGQRIRDKKGLDVRVGGYIAPSGGPAIRKELELLLRYPADPWQQHIDYEMLHPFTDGNGRSGRALWLWRMVNSGLGIPHIGFLHTFYYQTLANSEAQMTLPHLYRGLLW